MTSMVNSKLQFPVGVVFQGECLDGSRQIVRTCSLIDGSEHEDMQEYLETLRIQNPNQTFNYVVFVIGSEMVLQEGEDRNDDE